MATDTAEVLPPSDDFFLAAAKSGLWKHHQATFGNEYLGSEGVTWAITKGLCDGDMDVREFSARLLATTTLNFDAEELAVISMRMKEGQPQAIHAKLEVLLVIAQRS